MQNDTRNKLLPIMAGTAGHVDHGKTSLVRRLTGCDTDRLREEKARGLSIDFAVAPCPLPGGGKVGIIDVPGHLDFIRNMVAGASSVDILLLVIAADDGVMPQTREHLQIARLLGAGKLMGILTKIDMVDAERRERAKEEVSSFLESRGFPGAPLAMVSSQTGEGVEDLLQSLEKMALEATPALDNRAFRMDIRQGFAMKGHGTVVTGVPVSGSVQVGESLELWPQGRCVRLRGAQNYKQERPGTVANISAAINLRDVSPAEVSRGMTVAAPGVYRPSSSVIVHFRNLSKEITLRNNTELIFHCGTSALPVSLKLIQKTETPPGDASFAQARLPEARIMAAGDRFILRRPSPSVTVGGGLILSARESFLRRSGPFQKDRLERALKMAEDGDFFLCELLAGPGAFLRFDELKRLTCHPEVEAAKLSREKEGRGELLSLGAGEWLIKYRTREVIRMAQNHLRRYHCLNKYAWGMEPGYFCRLLGIQAGSFKKLSSLLIEEGGMALRRGRVALADYEPAMDARQIHLREKILARMRSASPNWVARGNLLRDLGGDNGEVKAAVKLLTDEGLIFSMGSYVLLKDSYKNCRAVLLNLFRQGAWVNVGAFRKATGLPRNTAVAILESFDSEGLTRREGDSRVLLRT